MRLYRAYGEKYRTNVERYQALLAEKRRLKLRLKRGDKLSDKTLAEYPEIPFLREKNEAKAEAMLGAMSDCQIRCTIHQVEDLSLNYVYREINRLITDFKYQIYRKKHPSSSLGSMDPRSSVTITRRAGHRTGHLYYDS